MNDRCGFATRVETGRAEAWRVRVGGSRRPRWRARRGQTMKDDWREPGQPDDEPRLEEDPNFWITESLLGCGGFGSLDVALEKVTRRRREHADPEEETDDSREHAFRAGWISFTPRHVSP